MPAVTIVIGIVTLGVLPTASSPVKPFVYIAMADTTQAATTTTRGTGFVCTSSNPFPEVIIAIALASVSRKPSRRCESGSVRSSYWKRPSFS